MKHALLGLLLGWLSCWPRPCPAQEVARPPEAPKQPARLELPLENYSSEVHVQAIPEDSSAVLLIEKEPDSGRKSEFSFQKLNSRLQSVLTLPLEVPREMEFAEICAEERMVYALFQDDVQGHKLWVAALNTRTGEIRTTSFDTKISREIYELKSLGGNLFVTVQVQEHITVLLLNLHTGQHQFLPSVFEQIPAQLTFVADSVSKRAKFVVSQTNGRKSRLLVKQLSPQGQLLRTEYVQAGSDRSLLTAQLSPGDTTARLLTGTYTLRDVQYSQGLFASDLAAGVTPTGTRESLRFYDFLNLKHFFDFMRPAHEARFRQRGLRKRAAAGQFRLHYRLLMHDLVPFQGGYVLLAEVYYPRYRYYNAYGYYSYLMDPHRIFEGYHTSHAIICGFDKHGTLLWDNTFVLKDVEHYNLLETVRLQPLPDGRRLALAYLNDNKVEYKIVDRATTSPNDLSVPVQTSIAGAKEKPTSTEKSNIVSWYGSRFLAYGYQHIRVDNGPDRDVFFLNTIAFD